VLRLGPGDEIILLDNSGWEYLVEISSVERGGVKGIVRDKVLSTNEPATQITLYQALLKSNKFEFVLQKGTELGIRGFVPLFCERSIVDVADNKMNRWQRIIMEAAEQSRRARLSILYPAMPFDEACRSVSGISLLLWEGERELSLRAALADIKEAPQALNLFIGPEGGFSVSEVEFARRWGIVPITLGGRILRAETAGLVAAAAILYQFGDLGG